MRIRAVCVLASVVVGVVVVSACSSDDATTVANTPSGDGGTAGPNPTTTATGTATATATSTTPGPVTGDCVTLPSLCGPGTECNTTTKQCQGKTTCTQSSECDDAALPICSGSRCAICKTSDECKTRSDVLRDGKATCLGGKCVECSDNAGCTVAERPFCDLNASVCVGCTASFQCPSSLCKTDESLLDSPTAKVGECVPESIAAIVSLTNAACVKVAGAGAGSEATPFCDIQQAIDAGKSYLDVRASSGNTDYAPFVVDKKSIFIVGTGRDLGRPGFSGISSSDMSGYGARVTGSGAKLYIKGMHFLTYNGIKVDTGATLVAFENFFLDNGVGILAEATAADVRIERNYISTTTNISVKGGTFRIVNNGIFGGSTGVELASGTTGVFAFNSLQSITAGVTCGSSQTVRDSILSQSPNSGCILLRTTTESTSFVSPSFSQHNFTVVDNAQAEANVFDKSITDDTVKDDYNGDLRPKGAAYDLGAVETK